MIRVGSDTDIGINRNSSDWLGMNSYPILSPGILRIISLAHFHNLFIHGETFYMNFYYSIFQFREKRITLRIFVSKNTKLYNNDIKLQHSS